MESVRRNLGASAPQYMSARVSGAAPEPVRMGRVSPDTSAVADVAPLGNVTGSYSGRRTLLAPFPPSGLEEPDTLSPAYTNEAAGRRVYSAGSSGSSSGSVSGSSLDGQARFSLSPSGRLHRVA